MADEIPDSRVVEKLADLIERAQGAFPLLLIGHVNGKVSFPEGFDEWVFAIAESVAAKLRGSKDIFHSEKGAVAGNVEAELDGVGEEYLKLRPPAVCPYGMKRIDDRVRDHRSMNEIDFFKNIETDRMLPVSGIEIEYVAAACGRYQR